MSLHTASTAPVAIVGAGIGGLSLALALRARGLAAQVFEARPSLAEVGAGITLWSNAITALRSCGAYESVRAKSLGADGGVIGLSDGRVLSTTTLRELKTQGAPLELWTVHRAELQGALYELLPAECVHFDAAFERYEPCSTGVLVHLRNHDPLKARLLVGADGLRSRVRAQLFGEHAPRYAGYGCYRGVAPIPRGWRGTVGEFWGVGTRFGVARLPGNRLYWFAVVSQPEGTATAAEPKTALTELFAAYRFDVPEIIEATAPAAILYHDLYDRPPLSRWSSGSVCLLGDAAHPTTPNLGQGAAMAVESSVILAGALATGASVPQALRCYERLRAGRTAQITNLSRRLGQAAQLRNPVLRWLRNTAIRLLPQGNRQLRALIDYDANAETFQIDQREW